MFVSVCLSVADIVHCGMWLCRMADWELRIIQPSYLFRYLGLMLGLFNTCVNMCTALFNTCIGLFCGDRLFFVVIEFLFIWFVLLWTGCNDVHWTCGSCHYKFATEAVMTWKNCQQHTSIGVQWSSVVLPMSYSLMNANNPGWHNSSKTWLFYHFVNYWQWMIIWEDHRRY